MLGLTTRLMQLATMLALGCASCEGLAESTVWNVHDAARVAGHRTQVLGSPGTATIDGRRALCFDGISDGIVVSTNPISGWPQFTIEALIRPAAGGGEEQRFLHIEDERSSRLLLETRLTPERRWALDTFLYKSRDENRVLLDRAKLHETQRWHWVALTFDGQTMAHHVNGVRELDGPVTFHAMTDGRVSLGVRLNQRSWYNGCIAEVRFTPRALSSSELLREVPR